MCSWHIRKGASGISPKTMPSLIYRIMRSRNATQAGWNINAPRSQDTSTRLPDLQRSVEAIKRESSPHLRNTENAITRFIVTFYTQFGRFILVYVVHRKVASVLVAINSCDVSTSKQLLGITSVIWPPQPQAISAILSYKMIGNSYVCEG